MFLNYIIIIGILSLGVFLSVHPTVVCRSGQDAVYLFGNKKSPKNRMHTKLFVIIIFGFLSFLTSFRAYKIGTDTKAYIDIYNQIALNGFDASTHVEIGYKALNYIFSNILKLNYRWFFIAYSIFIYFVFARFIYKYAKNIVLSVLIFFTTEFLYINNIMRQMIAVAILCIAFECFINKKYIKSLAIILVAALFHKSALVFFVVPILNRYKFPKELRKIIYLSIELFVLAAIGLFVLMRFSLYKEYFDIYGGFNVAKVAYLLIDLLVFLLPILFPSIGNVYMDSIRHKSKNSNAFNLVRWTQFILLFADLGAFVTTIFTRIAIYFSFIHIITVPNYIEATEKCNRKLLYAIVVLVFAIYYLAKIYLSDNSDMFPFLLVFDL